MADDQDVPEPEPTLPAWSAVEPVPPTEALPGPSLTKVFPEPTEPPSLPPLAPFTPAPSFAPAPAVTPPDVPPLAAPSPSAYGPPAAPADLPPGYVPPVQADLPGYGPTPGYAPPPGYGGSAPLPSGVSGPPMGYGPVGPLPTPESQSLHTQAIVAVAISSVLTLMCCQPLGIASIVTSAIAIDRARKDVRSARTLLLWSWIMLGISVALGVLLLAGLVWSGAMSEMGNDY